MKKRLVGISIGALQRRYGDARALEIAKEIGADAVDFNLDYLDHRNPEHTYHLPEDELVAYYAGLKKKADGLGLIISQTHGRITGFRDIKEEDGALIENARIDLLVTKTLGAPVCVMHSVTTIWMGKDADPKRMRELNFDMFTRILPYAKEYGVRVASETFGDATGLGVVDFFGDIKEFLASYNRVRAVDDYANWFFTCADTGHSNKAMRFGNPTPADVIRMLGAHTVALHLNDNDTLTDQHKIPLTGTIDWRDVFDALDEVGYDGVYNMELALQGFFGDDDFIVDHAAFAVKVMRHLLEKRYGN